MDQLHQFLKAEIILKLSLMLPFKDIVRENGNTATKMFTVFLSNHYFSVCYNSIPKMSLFYTYFQNVLPNKQW